MSYSRLRIRDMRLPTTKNISNVYATQPWNNNSYDVHPSSYGEIRTMKDNSNKDFRRSMKGRGLVLSDCCLTVNNRSVTNGTISYDNGVGFTCTQVGDCSTYLQLDTPSLLFHEGNTDLDQLTLMKAFAKINASDLLVGEFVKDLNETLSMLRRPFHGVAQLVRKILTKKHTLMKASISTLEASKDAWLEYRYGWKPLISDIETVVDLVATRAERHGSKKLVARTCETISSKGLASTSPKYAHPMVGCSGTMTKTFSRRCTAGVFYSLDEAAMSAAKIQGTRPRDFGPTVWECIPYSFVADWFINVGDWLQAISPVPGITYTGWWVTNVTKTETSSSGSVAYPDPQPAYNSVYHGSLGTVITKDTVYKRTCNQLLNFTPVWKKKHLSNLQAADAMALTLSLIWKDLNKLKH